MTTPNDDQQADADAVFPADDAPTQEYVPADPQAVDPNAVDPATGAPAPQAYAAVEPGYYAESAEPVAEDSDDDEDPDSRRSINWPTVIVAAGLAGLVSAIVLAIGMVGVMVADSAARNNSTATPTVVNLGAQQNPAATTAAPAAPAAPAGTDPAATTPAPADAAPVVPGSPAAPAAPAATTSAAPATTAQTSVPTLAMFQGQLRLLESNAPASQKAQVLEGGNRAVGQMTSILQLVRSYSYTGFKYQLIGPVTQNGDTATARLQMTLPGYDARYTTLKWVNVGGNWKLSNKSVCDLAAYAQQSCSVG
ncbi:MAG: hypothetical protein QM658_04215 [Gordonia sp. (in: high G+C Gram-positive bacteria)]